MSATLFNPDPFFFDIVYFYTFGLKMINPVVTLVLYHSNFQISRREYLGFISANFLATIMRQSTYNH